MLNARALSTLLTDNRDGRLCKAWYLMTTNGTLLAYSQPNSITDLRRQAAIAAVTWQEQEPHHNHHHHHPYDHHDHYRQHHNEPTHHQPTTITIETETANTLIRHLDQNLLLVLEGGIPPARRSKSTTISSSTAPFERRITVYDSDHAADDIRSALASRDASRAGTPDPGSSPVSTTGSVAGFTVGMVGGNGGVGGSLGKGGAASRVLRMQRLKLEVLAEEVGREIRAQRFVMPGLGEGEF